MMVKQFLTYARYIVRHKLVVGWECLKRGLLIESIIHDWSKLTPAEFSAYMHFYGTQEKERTPAMKEAYALAWTRHVNRHPHHFQHWIAVAEDGTMRIKEMSDRARKEMIADWIGANKARGGDGVPSLKKWYLDRKDKMPIHRRTKNWIEGELGL